MPSTPYAQLLVAVNGGAPQSGGITALNNDVLSFSAQDYTGWNSNTASPLASWQIFDFPDGFVVPAGWSTASDGSYYYLGNTPPPDVVLPATLWGKFMLRLTACGGLKAGVSDPSMIDEATAVRVLGPGGTDDVGLREQTQFYPRDGWVGAVKRGNHAAIESGIAAARAVGGIRPWLIDANSLVPGRLDSSDWRVWAPSMAPSFRGLTATDSVGFLTLVRINEEGDSVPGAYLARPFTPPAGVTKVVLEVDDVSSTTAVQFALEVWDVAGLTRLEVTLVTPTTTATQYATGEVDVVPGSEYVARLVTNTTGSQAKFTAGRIRVRPTESSVPFWVNGFIRVPVDNNTLYDNNETGRGPNPRFIAQSSLAYVDLASDANPIIETYNSIGNAVVPPNDALSLEVDGNPVGSVSPAVDVVDYVQVAIPAGGGGIRRLRVLAGPGLTPDGALQWTPVRGTFLCGIYMPASSSTTMIAVQQAQDINVAYGDSKLAGFYATVDSLRALIPMLRRLGDRWISETYGGRYFTGDFPLGGTTVVDCVPFARKCCTHAPTRIVVGIGRNDFVGATMTLAQWTTRLGNFVDAIHEVSPQTRVDLLTFTSETTEAANANGDSWESWRLAMSTVAAAVGADGAERSKFCKVLDGAGLWTSAQAVDYTTDGVHPNDRGQAKLIALLSRQPVATLPLELPGLKLLAVGDAGMTPGTGLGPVVKSDGAAPTLTFTGAPAVLMDLRVAIRTGGTLGAAKFAFSVDGGLTWVANPAGGVQFTTGANVVLSVEGVSTGVTAHFPAGSYSNLYVYATHTLLGAWNDQSGAGNHLVTTGSPNYYALLGINGRRALWNDSSARYMKRAGIALAQPFAVIVAARGDGSADRMVFGSQGGAGPYLYAGTTSSITLAAGVGLTVNVNHALPHVYTCVFNGASSNLRIDGVDNVGAGGAVALTDLTVGGNDTLAKGWSDSVCGVIVLDHAPTVTEMRKAEAYFTNYLKLDRF